jgi:hypothetical protein
VRTNCGICSTPLNGQEEFVGHLIHSHAFEIGQAKRAWEIFEVHSRTSTSDRGLDAK